MNYIFSQLIPSLYNLKNILLAHLTILGSSLKEIFDKLMEYPLNRNQISRQAVIGIWFTQTDLERVILE